MDTKISALQNARSSAQLKAAVDALPREEKYFTIQVRDLLLQKQQFIVDSAIADSITSFLLEFGFTDAGRVVLQTLEMRHLLIVVVAPLVKSPKGVYYFGRSICRIVHDKTSRDLYSTRESLKVILSCFHRATTSEGAAWIACAINNILIRNPSAKHVLNGLPVVEAFSALLPLATSDEAVMWISNAFEKLLRDNDAAHEAFGSLEFVEKFKAIEKFGTSIDAKDAFKSIFQPQNNCIVESDKHDEEDEEWWDDEEEEEGWDEEEQDDENHADGNDEPEKVNQESCKSTKLDDNDDKKKEVTAASTFKPFASANITSFPSAFAEGARTFHFTPTTSATSNSNATTSTMSNNNNNNPFATAVYHRPDPLKYLEATAEASLTLVFQQASLVANREHTLAEKEKRLRQREAQLNERDEQLRQLMQRLPRTGIEMLKNVMAKLERDGRVSDDFSRHNNNNNNNNNPFANINWNTAQ